LDLRNLAADSLSIWIITPQTARPRPWGDSTSACPRFDPSIGYTGGGHTYPDYAARLKAAGANFVCDDWHEISRQLSGLGVPA
jgi:hypothetical protein